MRRNNQGHAAAPAIRPLYLMVSFFGSFIVVLTFTLMYGSNLVVLNSSKTLHENLLIGIAAPKDDAAKRLQSREEPSATHDNPKTTLDHDTINQCGNSERWLNSRRYGNLDNDALFTTNLASSLLLDLDTILVPESSQQHSNVLRTLLDRSICHASSHFMNSTIPPASSSSSSISNDPRSVRLWAFKLIYLAMHYHQHRLAVPEAKVRFAEQPISSCPNSDELWSQHRVGVFDYECPDAKYLVMPLGGNGLGSNIRGGTVLAYLTGLVVFLSYTETGHEYLQMGWPLASCDRFDYQCFFMPPTPCTVTHEELANAYQLTNKNFRSIMKLNSILPEVAHHKVWTFNSQFVPITYFPVKAMLLLQKYAEKLVAAVPQAKYPGYKRLLKEAASTIGKKDGGRDGYNYAAASFKVHHALTLYSLRPNPTSAQKLANIMTDIIPKELDPERAVGLPIRASDKCTFESECLSFDQHMQVASALWAKDQANATATSAQKGQATPSIVFTTESRSMVEEQEAYETAMTDRRFAFVTNTRDVLPDSGFMKDVEWKAEKNQRDADPDAIMLSAMSSLQAQLLPKITIGNCCSNFHTMMNDLLSEGCGAADENHFVCLQEYEDPRLRVCCGWHNECPANREKAIQELEGQKNI